MSGTVLDSENIVVSSKLDLVLASWSQSVPHMKCPHLNGHWICPFSGMLFGYAKLLYSENAQGAEFPEGHCLCEMTGVGSSLNRPPSDPAGPGLPDKSDPRGFRSFCAPCGDSGSCLWRTKPQIFSPTPELETSSAYLRVFIWTLRVCHVCVFG